MVFTLGSLLCGLSKTLELLILSRCIQDNCSKVFNATTFDLVGAIQFVVSVLAFLLAVNVSQDVGLFNPYVLLTLVDAIILFVFFIRHELKASYPFLDLTILKNLWFFCSHFCGFISFLAINCINIIQPYYYQNVKGYSQIKAGVIMMSTSIVLSVVAPLSGTLSDKIGSEILTFLGLVIEMIGFLLMSTVDRNKLGVAGSINALVRNMGMILGVLFSTALLYARMSSVIGRHI